MVQNRPDDRADADAQAAARHAAQILAADRELQPQPSAGHATEDTERQAGGVWLKYLPDVTSLPFSSGDVTSVQQRFLVSFVPIFCYE